MASTKDVVLARIRTYDMGFLVNGDDRKTSELRTEMLNKPWDKHGFGKQIKELDFVIERDCYQSWLQMSENYRLNDLLPKKTRFRLVKRFIKRIMKVTTRYQEEFNKATIGIVQTISKAIDRLRVAILKINGRQNQLEFQLEDMQAEIDNLRVIIEQQQEAIERLSSNMRGN